MASPTPTNYQISDAIAIAGVATQAQAPTVALGTIYQSLAHATGILLANGNATYQQGSTLSQAGSNQGIMQMYSVGTAATAEAVETVSDESERKSTDVKQFIELLMRKHQGGVATPLTLEEVIECAKALGVSVKAA
jgi:hypothetical protein